MHRFLSQHKSVSTPVIDGVSGPGNIANLWCDIFKWLYNTLDGSVSADLLSLLDSGISCGDLDRTFVSVEVIEFTIGKLKCGKI